MILQSLPIWKMFITPAIYLSLFILFIIMVFIVIKRNENSASRPKKIKTISHLGTTGAISANSKLHSNYNNIEVLLDGKFGYADFRRDYADEWISTEEGGYGRTLTIWQETDVVFVSDGVYNDTIVCIDYSD